MQEVQNVMQKMILSLENKMVSDFFDLLPSGKKLRSKLILNIASNSDEVLKLCAIVELIHLASLLHDDVIDNSLKRRGNDSFNAIYGDKNAIMLGDILYAKAFFELSFFDEKIAKTISQAVTRLSIGELEDVELGKSFNEDKEKYMQMIYNKTASLIEASAKAAAILANKDAQKFSIYGKNLGIAFQIVDDILDITQTSEVLGKPNLSDFKEGKTTLPYMFAYERLDFHDKMGLKKYFKQDLNKTQSDWIMQKLIQINAIEDSIQEAKNYANKALLAIKDQSESKLEEIALDMIQRKF